MRPCATFLLCIPPLQWLCLRGVWDFHGSIHLFQIKDGTPAQYPQWIHDAGFPLVCDPLSPNQDHPIEQLKDLQGTAHPPAGLHGRPGRRSSRWSLAPPRRVEGSYFTGCRLLLGNLAFAGWCTTRRSRPNSRSRESLGSRSGSSRELLGSRPNSSLGRPGSRDSLAATSPSLPSSHRMRCAPHKESNTETQKHTRGRTSKDTRKPRPAQHCARAGPALSLLPVPAFLLHRSTPAPRGRTAIRGSRRCLRQCPGLSAEVCGVFDVAAGGDSMRAHRWWPLQPLIS